MSGAAFTPAVFLRLVAQPEAVKRARDEVTAAGRGWGLTEAALETLRLLTSEIVTNTLHLAAGQKIEVCATLNCDCVVLDVWDPAPLIPKGDVPPVMPEAAAQSGRGLPLVELLSSRWYEQASAGRDGKHLLAHIPRDSLATTCGCAEKQQDIRPARNRGAEPEVETQNIPPTGTNRFPSPERTLRSLAVAGSSAAAAASLSEI